MRDPQRPCHMDKILQAIALGFLQQQGQVLSAAGHLGTAVVYFTTAPAVQAQQSSLCKGDVLTACNVLPQMQK